MECLGPARLKKEGRISRLMLISPKAGQPQTPPPGELRRREGRRKKTAPTLSPDFTSRTEAGANQEVPGTHRCPAGPLKHCTIWVLILTPHKTLGKTSSFLRKKSKQTAHTQRWERCFQKKKKQSGEERNVCARILRSIWHAMGAHLFGRMSSSDPYTAKPRVLQGMSGLDSVWEQHTEPTVGPTCSAQKNLGLSQKEVKTDRSTRKQRPRLSAIWNRSPPQGEEKAAFPVVTVEKSVIPKSWRAQPGFSELPGSSTWPYTTFNLHGRERGGGC